MSTLAPLGRQRADPNLVKWLDQNGARLFLPAIAVAELIAGVANLRRLGRITQADELEAWVGVLKWEYAGRLLPLDAEAAHQTGLLIDLAKARGVAPGFADIAIAGIAATHAMVLLTRNLRHFAPLGIAASDPFAVLPA